MLNYIFRRVLIGILTLLCISFVIYGLIRNMPGSPLDRDLMDPSRKFSKEDRLALEKLYGLDQPWYIGYGQWMSGVLVGDFGKSFSYRAPVGTVIGERVAPTLFLSGTSLFLSYLLAVPMGLYATARRNRWDERSIGISLYMLYSFPSFVAAIFLQMIFAVWLDWLPLLGMRSGDYANMTTLGKAYDLFSHAILPITVMTYGGLAFETRFVRANLLEVTQQDYIRTARAKGVHPFRILVVHAFRNTMLPLITLIGLSLPALLSGSVIIEQIFNWQGMGWLFFESISTRDYPVIMGLTLMFSFLTLLGQLLADIMYAIADPRVTLG